jgi:hypothetical protein
LASSQNEEPGQPYSEYSGTCIEALLQDLSIVGT